MSSSVALFFCCWSFLASGHFQWVNSSHQVAKVWTFGFSTNPFNEYSGPISFNTDWFVFLVVQGTLKSLLQHHNAKGSVLQCSAFFMVQFSHLCMKNSAFSLSSLTLIRRLFHSSSLSAQLEWHYLHIWDHWYLSWQFQEILIPAYIHLAWHFTWCTLHIS